MRVLYTTPVLEHPPAGGPQLRIENSIKALARACELDIVYRYHGPMNLDAAAMAFYRGYCGEFVAREYSCVSANRWVRAAQRLARVDIARQADLLLAHAARRGIQVVWFGYGNISWPLIRRLRSANPSLKLVCDTDSVWSRYVLRELPYARGLRRLSVLRRGRAKAAEERAWVNLCDVTTAVSEVDAQYYRSLAGEPRRIQVFANVIDPETYAREVPPPPEMRHPALSLAGTFGGPHSPMCQAAHWVIEEVLPLVRKQVPQVQLLLVGRDSDRHFGHLRAPGIVVTGMLPSALPYLRHADVALVPLKYESGTRFKILEAGACAVPVVTTTLGAEGLPVEDGRHVLVADDAAGFAAAIVRLLEDSAFAARLAAGCRDLVARQFGIDALEAQARSILSGLR